MSKRRFRRWVAAALSIAALTVGIDSARPAGAAGPQIDMKLLLISAQGTDPAWNSFKSELDNEGVPYDTLIATTQTLTASTLQNGNEAKYQGIVLATDDLAWYDGTSWTSAFDSTEWSVLRAYETTFGIRQLDTYAYPKPNIGLNWPFFAGSLAGLTATVTPAGTNVFPYLVGQVPIQSTWGYLATPLNANFTPLVQAPTGEPIVGSYVAPDGHEEMVNTLDGATWLLNTKLVQHGELAWVTKGVYFGMSRNYVAIHIDDLFSSSDKWDPVLHRIGTGTTRLTAADVTYARDWSIANGFRLDFGFNAANSSGDALTTAVLANKQYFWFWNHTWTHADLTSSPQQEIVDEINTNKTWAAQNGITNFNPGDLVTGGHSGLANSNMPAALTQTGINYIGSDNSYNRTSYMLGPARVTPRYPTNIYYNTSTRVENLDEYNWKYFYNCLVGCIPSALTWTQLVDNEANVWLAHATGNDPRTSYVHQGNLTNDRILYDVLNSLIAKYRLYLRAPFTQPTLAESGQVFARTAGWTAATQAGTASGYIQDGLVHIATSGATDVPIAGTSVGDIYGGERSGWTTVNGTATLPALGPRAADTAPVASAQSVTTAEDTPKPITLVATDAEGDPLTYAVVAQPAHGSLSGAGAALTYTPAADYSGPDSFTFKADDATFDSNIATVSITVTAVNDAPVADPKSITGAHSGRASALTLSGSDVDSSPLTFSVVSAPSHGSLSAITGTTCTPAAAGATCSAQVTYTPATGYVGADSFTYKTSDGTLVSVPATVSVQTVNAAPVASAQSVSGNEDADLPIGLGATDADGDSLTYTIVSGPAKGTLAGSGNSRTYTPNLDYNGGDSFTFKVNDGITDSNVATVSITVNSVNDAPKADAKSISVSKNSSQNAVTLSGSDVDSAALTFTVITPPSHGSVTSVTSTSCSAAGAGSSCTARTTYSPANGYVGSDSFVYRVSDGSLFSTAVVTVNTSNTPPSASNQSATTDEDTSSAITLTATDADGDALTYTTITPPSHGSLTGSGASLTYSPSLNYNGPDSFQYTANDGTTTSNVATVSITVRAVNDAPQADPKILPNAHGGSPASLTLTSGDVDSAAQTFSIGSQPAHGTLGAITGTSCSAAGAGSNCSAQIAYTATPGYSGSDSFTYIANDGTASGPAATVTIVVGNSPPTANDVNVVTNEDSPVAVTLSGTDPDGDPLTFAVSGQPLHGTLSGAGASLTYSPDADYFGTDSFNYRASDGYNLSNPANVAITISSVNDKPVAGAQTLAGAHQGVGLPMVLSGTDIDSSSLSFSAGSPAHGTLSGFGAPSCVATGGGTSCTREGTYTPTIGYVGADSFTYTVSDGSLTSSAATVSISVANTAPVATGQTVLVKQNSPTDIALQATDADSDAMSFTVLAQPAHGSLTGSAPYLTYTPATNYAGADSFTFNASDGIASSNTASVSITVSPRRVVLSSDRVGGVRQVHSMEPTGDYVQQLTTGVGPNQEPARSPDGQYIVFSSNRDGNLEIYKSKIDGTALTRLTNNKNADTTPAWSPDGKKIAFSSTRSGSGDIYTMNPDGTQLTKLSGAAGELEDQPTWSPDSTKIVYRRNAGGGDIYTMTSSGGSRTRILGTGAHESEPAWSPDGTKIAYMTDANGNYEIYTMSTLGSSQVRLTNNSAEDSNPNWAKDGSKVTFTSKRDGNYEIYTMNPDGTSQTNISNSAGSADVQSAW